MVTKLVVEELLKPYILARGEGRVMDIVVPDMYAVQLDAFISHANDREFILLVDSLTKYQHFKNAAWSEIFICIDIVTIDLMKAMINKHDGVSLQQSLLECRSTMLVASYDRAYESPQLIHKLNQVRFYYLDRLPISFIIISYSFNSFSI